MKMPELKCIFHKKKIRQIDKEKNKKINYPQSPTQNISLVVHTLNNRIQIKLNFSELCNLNGNYLQIFIIFSDK